jgi:hypothetical protein
MGRCALPLGPRRRRGPHVVSGCTTGGPERCGGLDISGVYCVNVTADRGSIRRCCSAGRGSAVVMFSRFAQLGDDAPEPWRRGAEWGFSCCSGLWLASHLDLRLLPSWSGGAVLGEPSAGGEQLRRRILRR